MLKLFLWLRYLHKKKIVFLSIIAVALSVALLIVVNSLFTGYIKAINKTTVVSVGDIFLWPAASIPDYEVFLDRLESLDGVEAAAPFIFGGGLLHLETGDVREVAIQGIDPGRESKFTNWKESLLMRKASEREVNFEVEGYPEDDGVWLGVVIVAEPNEKTDEYDLAEIEKLVGKKIVLTTSGHGGKRKVVKLRISDIAFTQTYYGDKTLYLPFGLVHKIQYGQEQSDHTQSIKIRLKENADAESMKEVIRKEWIVFASENLRWKPSAISNITIRTSTEARGQFLAELRKQLGVVMFIFVIICSVSVLLIFCILYMIVETRLKDIAIIKSCGATSGAVVFIFSGFGGCIGAVGSLLGIILGFVVTRNINILQELVRVVFGLKLWRASTYGLNEIPHAVNWSAVGPIVLLAIAGCVIGALIPAIVAARTNPVKILRYE